MRAQLESDIAGPLSWLDYCIEEAQAAMRAVVAAVEVEVSNGTNPDRFYGLYQRQAELNHLRMNCSRIGQSSKYPITMPESLEALDEP